MQSPRTGPRNEYLRQESLRVMASPSLAEKFPRLKTLTADLGSYYAGGLVRNSQIKYTVNVEHARSVFRVACHSHECVRGDFDLSEVLAQAISEGNPTVSGEISCPGWRGRASIGTVPCGSILRYTLTLGY